MKKRVLFAVIIVASTAAAAYTLHILDTMIYGTLYSYGLQFDYGWANPYWLLLRTLWGLLAIIAATSIGSTLFYIRAARRQTVEAKPEFKTSLTSKAIEKTPIVTRTTERAPITFIPPSSPSPSSYAPAPPPPQKAQPSILKPVSVPVPAKPSPSSQPSGDLHGVFTCGHCGKHFTQPLRMLDFNSDRPRIVNICPFCNEIANTMPQDEEKDQIHSSRSSFGKNDDAPRSIAR